MADPEYVSVLETIATNEKDLVFQIRNYFKEFKIAEHDLKIPTSAFVIEFYKLFLSEFFIDANSVMQIQMPQMKILSDNTEMYTEIIPLINLATAVKSFNIPALKNFCITDLLNPTPRRTFNHLSNVMLFIMFADTKIASLFPKLEKMKDLETRKQNIIRNIDNMKQMYNKGLMDVADRKSKVKDTDAEMERLNEELDEMYRIKDELGEKNSCIKSQLNKLNSQYEDNMKELQMIENDVEEFNHRIKQLKSNDKALDPSSLTLSLEVLQEKASETKKKLEETRKALTNKQECHEEMTKLNKALICILGLLKEFTQHIKNKTEYDQKLDSLNKEITSLTKNIDRIKSSVQSKELDLNRENEELIGLQLQWNKQKSCLKESLDVAISEFESQNNVTLAKKDEQTRVNEQVENLKNKISQNEEYYEALLDGIEKEHSGRNDQFENTIQKITSFIRQFIHNRD